ncbi:MAG: metal-binding protein [Lachnospiraceae bacterium]|nr:metal-binding protein [Lachnospiraceae bacterium]
MKNSFSYFENRDCQYYPCHKGISEMNCMFCYCPLYGRDKCPGNPKYIGEPDNKVKDCSSCVFPHKHENYEEIISILMKK